MAIIFNPTSLNRITEYPNSFERQGAFPLERYSIFNSIEEAERYSRENPVAYVGQIIVVNKQEEIEENYTVDFVADYTLCELHINSDLDHLTCVLTCGGSLLSEDRLLVWNVTEGSIMTINKENPIIHLPPATNGRYYYLIKAKNKEYMPDPQNFDPEEAFREEKIEKFTEEERTFFTLYYSMPESKAYLIGDKLGNLIELANINSSFSHDYDKDTKTLILG